MTRKLYISMVMLCLAVFATTTATYAWLSLATSNAVRGIGLQANNGDELALSLDGINYYTNLPSELVMEQIKNLAFRDITSLDGKSFNYGINGETQNAIKNIDYISLTLYLRTKSAYMHEVYLSNNISNEVTYNEGSVGTYIVSKGRHWMSDVDYQYGPDEYVEKGNSKTYYVSEAMRVSFIDHETNTSKIFDLSGNKERGFGKAYGATSYYQAKTERQLTLPTKVPDTVYKLSEFDSINPYALDNSSHITTLKYLGHRAENGQYLYEGKVTMNIWVEGWDADLFDAIFGDQVKMQFQFKSVIGIKN